MRCSISVMGSPMKKPPCGTAAIRPRFRARPWGVSNLLKNFAKLAALSFCLASIDCALAAAGNHLTLFVAPNGSDAGLCTSIDAPCLTIQGAVDKVPQATGATIYVGAGTYSE